MSKRIDFSANLGKNCRFLKLFSSLWLDSMLQIKLFRCSGSRGCEQCVFYSSFHPERDPRPIPTWSKKVLFIYLLLASSNDHRRYKMKCEAIEAAISFVLLHYHMDFCSVIRCCHKKKENVKTYATCLTFHLASCSKLIKTQQFYLLLWVTSCTFKWPAHINLFLGILKYSGIQRLFSWCFRSTCHS